MYSMNRHVYVQYSKYNDWLNVCAVLKQVLMNSSEINTLKALKNFYSSTVLKFIFFHMTDFCIFCFFLTGLKWEWLH